MIKIGGQRIADIRVGSSRVKEVRIGGDLVWSRGKFVVVGQTGTYAVSRDGENWDVGNIDSAHGEYRAVTYGDGCFQAVGMGGAVATSSDGTSWSRITLNDTNRRAVAAGRSNVFGGWRVVAVGESGKVSYGGSVLHLTDIAVGEESNDWYGVAFGDGKFVAVGYSGSCAVSTDGMNWSTGSIGYGLSSGGVAFGNGKFVACADNGYIAYSTDGVNWTRKRIANSNNLKSITYGGGKFVAVGSGGTIAYSTDGVDWTVKKYEPAYSTSWVSVAYGNGKFVALSDGRIAYSSDGSNWNSKLVGENPYWRGVAFG